MPGWRGVIRIRGWFDENEGPLSADAVKFYKAGSTTEDPTIRIVPGAVPKIVFDDPLNKDIVQAIELEIEELLQEVPQGIFRTFVSAGPRSVPLLFAVTPFA